MAASMSIGQFPVSSKLLQKKWNEKQLKSHQTKIASMKADIDNKNPLNHSHLRLKLKKMQLEEESHATIDNKNRVLVGRISRIMKEPGRLDNWNETYKPKSLNQRHRSDKATRIQDENILLARRLNSIKPLYNAKKWENDFTFHEYVLHNMKSTTKDFEMVPTYKQPSKSYSPSNQEEKIRLPIVVDPRSRGRAGQESPPRPMKLPKLPPKSENGRSYASPEFPTAERKAAKIDRSPTTAGTDVFDPVRDAKLLHECEGDSDCVDCDILSRCFAMRKFRQRMQTREEFERIFDEDHLLDFLRDRYHPAFHPILIAFLSRREAYDAITLRDALDDAPRRGGREATLIEVLCTRHDLALKTIEKEYCNKYGSNLREDIKAMTSGSLQHFLLTLLSMERSSNIDVNQDLATKDAEELLKTDAEDRWRISEKDGRFRRMLTSQGYAQMRAAFVEYERISGLEASASVEAAMEDDDDVNVEYWNTVLSFVKCLRNCPAFFAECMHRSLRAVEKQSLANLKENNTSWAEKTLIRCLLTRCEADLAQILKAYKKRYGLSFTADIEQNCGLLYKDIILAIVKYQGQNSRRRHPQANGKRVAGMLIRGPPPRHLVSRPSPRAFSPERLQNSPLNKQSKATSNAKKAHELRGNLRKRSQSSNAATVHAARDFNAERDSEQIVHGLKSWSREGQQAVLVILTRRSNEQRQKLRQVYASKQKRDLISDLRNAAKDSLYGELLASWMKTKVEFDTITLRESLMHNGMQEVAMEIICTRTNKQVKAIGDAFRRLYGSTISETVKEKVKSGYWKQMLLSLSRNERDNTTTVSSGTALNNATSLYEDEITGLGGSKFNQIITKCNMFQIRATLNAFKKVSGKDFQEFIQNSPEDDEEKKRAMISLVACCKDSAAYFSKKLRRCIVQHRDILSVSRIFLSRAEVDLETIKQIYLDNYGISIKEDLISNCDDVFKQFLLKLLLPA